MGVKGRVFNALSEVENKNNLKTAGLKLLGELCLQGGPFGSVRANLKGACVPPSLKRMGFTATHGEGLILQRNLQPQTSCARMLSTVLLVTVKNQKSPKCP